MTRVELPGADIEYVTDAFEDADALFEQIHAETPWKQERITLFGRERLMPRLTCWMGEAAYVYSGLRNEPSPWSAPVEKVRHKAQELTGMPFNGVLLNLYRDGADSMGWHADDEKSLGPAPIIVSVSLGAVRRFRMKPKKHFEAETFGLDLASGSILVMRGETQKNWLHAIPKTKRDVDPRINLTFRAVADR